MAAPVNGGVRINPAALAPRSIAMTVLLALAGCTFHAYVPAPLDQALIPDAILGARFDDAETGALLTRIGAAAQWPLPSWTPAQLGLLAVARSHHVRAARAAVATTLLARARAGQRENPQLNLDLEHHSRDNDGRDSHWSIGPSFDYTLSPVSRRHIARARAEAALASAHAELQNAA